MLNTATNITFLLVHQKQNSTLLTLWNAITVLKMLTILGQESVVTTSINKYPNPFPLTIPVYI